MNTKSKRSVSGRAVLLAFILLGFAAMILWICHISGADFGETVTFTAVSFVALGAMSFLISIPGVGRLPMQ